MDELERVVAALVRNIEARFPSYLAAPFRVQEIHETILPYRAHRATIGVETNEYYELALTRLLAGEGGFLVAPDEVQQALRSEMQSPNPDSARYRRFGTSDVTLTAAALSLRNEVLKPVSAASAVPAAAPKSNSDSAQSAPLPVKSSSQAPTKHAPIKEWIMPPGQRTTTSAEAGGKCRYCHGVLPEGRDMTYCPHCGQDLTVHHCPACSTELEVGWKFCVTCGRSVAE